MVARKKAASVHLMSTRFHAHCACSLIMEVVLCAFTANDVIVRRKASPSPIDCLHLNVPCFGNPVPN